MPGIKGVTMAILAIFFMVFPLFYKTKFKCKDCGLEFKKNKKQV